jgi:hypothetical protein
MEIDGKIRFLGPNSAASPIAANQDGYIRFGGKTDVFFRNPPSK